MQTELVRAVEKIISLISKANKHDRQFSVFRLAVFILTIILGLISFYTVSDELTLLIFLIGAIIFAILAHLHSRLSDKIKRLNKWLIIKETHLARKNLEWIKIPHPKTGLEDIDPIERDLNLVGDRSLLHLISTCTTQKATEKLRLLLINKNPNLEDILHRQKLVKELSIQNRFRDRLLLQSLLAKNLEDNSSYIYKWLKQSKSERMLQKIFWFFTTFAGFNAVLLFGYLLDWIPNLWIMSVLLYFSIYYFLSRKIATTSKDAEILKNEIGRYAGVFEFIESYRFTNSPTLEEFLDSLKMSLHSPSKIFNSVRKYVEIMSFRSNALLWTLIIMFFPIDYYLGFKVEQKKKILELHFHKWLNTWYNLEAFCSLANFASLNPEYNFPEFVNKSVANTFLSVSEIGHPLIPRDKKIKNSFKISSIHEVFVLTGSNMSGKSTFLRTIGINLLLGYSGAPVDSKSFFMHLMKIFTCINVSDSVVDGISYFYAEVRRLKELIDQLSSESEIPILFLIDEIFKGTNNIERLKGSQFYIHWLLDQNATGLIATHDLELTKLADEFKNVHNYHFREEVRESKMIFDFKLHTGPCPTTNALTIMELEGLPVH